MFQWKRASPHKCYHGKTVWSFSSNVWSVITEILRKSLTLRILPFKVTSRSLEHCIYTRSDRLPMTCCQCSMVCVGISRTVSRIKGDNCRILKTSPPSCIYACVDGFPCIVLAAMGANHQNSYKSVKKCDDIYIHLDTIPAFDGQTDGIAKTRLATANRPRVNILVITVLFRAGDVVDPVTMFCLITNSPCRIRLLFLIPRARMQTVPRTLWHAGTTLPYYRGRDCSLHCGAKD